MISIRAATDSDRDTIWEIFREVIVASETYPIDATISRDDALAYWFQKDAHAFVAQLDCLKQSTSREPAPAFVTLRHAKQTVGSYTLHANQGGGGRHVANAAFIVAKDARGQGIGRALGEHCFEQARALGFGAMQFNFVISTNTAAVKLWQHLGMKIVGTLPGAFRHPQKGYVDVYVMFRSLEPW